MSDELQQNEETKQQLTADHFLQFIETDEGQKAFQPIFDQKVTKAINTYREKTVPSLIEEEIQKRFPAKTEDQKQIDALRLEMEQMKAEKTKAEQQSIALEYATKLNVPSDLATHFLGSSAEETRTQIETLSKVLEAERQKVRDSLLKETSRDVVSGGDSPTISLEDVDQFTPEQYEKHRDEIMKLLQNKEAN